ncbi:MAG: GTP-binding protein [Chloroflexi bacterium]|nr:MAG: GTP-binding protein [Chloroflexota bacterium]
MAIVNLGILAHVDAGKTSLTERILYETGVIRTLGSVDKGTTQTDTLELERARGITIQSAVVSFDLPTRKVNLIDTPGHGDFIAEVARSLRVLDAVVLVVSAVEGVQSQTRRLMRAVRAAGLPVLIFINKIDRLGARDSALLEDVRRKLHPRIVPLNAPRHLGERHACVQPLEREDPAWRAALTDLLAESSDAVIEAWEQCDGDLSLPFLETELRRQVASGLVVPVYFGSAITGAGVRELLAGVEAWLPSAGEDCHQPPSGTVFKIARRPSGEKIVYVRLVSGRLAVRERVTLQRPDAFGEPLQFDERITAIDCFSGGATQQATVVTAGEIAGLHGLRSARIGDSIGTFTATPERSSPFPAPPLESVVQPLDPSQITRMRAALEQLAEQDPLISLRQRNDEGEVSVRLYGDVQKEVLTETLLREFNVGVAFGPSRTICIERPAGVGAYLETIFTEGNPYYATIGLRVEPAEVGSGIRYHRELGALLPAFYRALEETIYDALRQGLYGWEVTDCEITLTHAGYNSILSTAADFRKLAPLVLLQALQQAGTLVCEPIEELEIEIPEDTFGAVCGALINARATIRNSYREGAIHRIISDIPTAELRAVERQLPALTRGEGSWVASPAGYVTVSGDPPTRPRTGPNPLNKAHYLAEVARG